LSAAEQVELVVFRVGSEDYALDLAEVREVTRAPQIVPLASPAAPAVGVGGEGDEWILLVSARERLGLPDEELTFQRMIVARLPGGLEIGLLVERVREVVTLSRDDLLPPPAIFGESGASRVRSLVRLPGDRLLLLVSMEDLFSSPEVERLEAAERDRRANGNPDQGGRE
jgi:purine-binding chemotaxis protein CheW